VENINVNFTLRVQEWLDLFHTYRYNIREERSPFQMLGGTGFGE
jgi:hypothetical protein